ncbi:NACHT and WD repeat domain-containing protein 2 [Caerostris extrusa]|uniref:NACHT and WD repeat domain-containing protein 2 n=1 Tax=Caerostris extrusa TaxID=172846 RepID=A0AAV4MLH3_CAEEX|nr:NACHT and WD repeat domain-containing protein 2 [Caerostris extrusa]
MEREALAQRVFPYLRRYSAEKGYGLFSTTTLANASPRTLPKPHLNLVMESVETLMTKNFQKWYILDSVASPMVYVLQPVIQKLPFIAGEDPSEEKCMNQWKEESQK